MTQGFGGFLLLFGASWFCGCGGGCRQVVVLGSDGPSLHAMMQIKIKTIYPQLM